MCEQSLLHTHTLSLSTHMRTSEHSYIHAHLFHPTTFPPRPQVPEGTPGMQEKQSRRVCCGELAGPCQKSPTYQNKPTNDSLLTRGLNEKIYSSPTHTKATWSHGTQSMGTCCMLWLGLVTILVCVADQSSSPTLPAPPLNMQRQVLSPSLPLSLSLSPLPPLSLPLSLSAPPLSPPPPSRSSPPTPTASHFTRVLIINARHEYDCGLAPFVDYLVHP